MGDPPGQRRDILRGGRSSSPRVISRTHRMHRLDSAGDDHVSGHAPGWFIISRDQGMTPYHGGSTTSSTSHVVIFPEEEVRVVALCNRAPFFVPRTGNLRYLQRHLPTGKDGSRFPPVPKDLPGLLVRGRARRTIASPPVNATPALPPGAYAGRYLEYNHGPRGFSRAPESDGRKGTFIQVQNR